MDHNHSQRSNNCQSEVIDEPTQGQKPESLIMLFTF